MGIGDAGVKIDLHHPVAGAALGVLGLLSLGLATWHLVLGVDTGATLLVGVVPPILLSLAIVLAGSWVATSAVGDASARRLVAWPWAGAAFGTGGAGLLVLYQSLHGVVVADAVFSVGAAASGGMIGGLVVGAYDARARQRRTELDETSQVLETVRRVSQRVVRADSRQALESAVCEELAAGDSYVFAWIGHVDETAEEVVPGASTDAAAEYLENVRIPLVGQAASGPTATAVTTGEVQVVPEVRVEEGYEPWREAAQAHGVRSSIAVPLVYGDTTYGVLNVYAPRPRAFQARERAVLAELGDTIAYGLAALESRARFRALVESAPDPIVVSDLETGDLVEVNEAAVGLLGEDRDSLLAADVREVYPAAVHEDLAALEATASAETGPEEFVRLGPAAIDADGDPVFVEIAARVFDLAGRPVVQAHVRDVTERHSTQLELERYRQLVQNVPVGIYRIRPDPEPAFVEVNDALVEMLGAPSADALLDRPVRDLFPEAEPFEAFARRLGEEGVAVAEELELQTLDGEPFWGAFSAIQVTEESGAVFVDGAVEDVTARRAYQNRLERQADQLEALNQLLRHDIRNDMTVIQAYAEMLEGVEGVDDDQLARLLEKVDHVVELTNTARDLTEAMQGDEGPDSQSGQQQLDAVLLRVASEVRTSYPQAEVVVEDPPAVAVAADDLLDSVFRNLVNNAIQHAEAPDPRVEVTVDVGDDEAVVHVADDGPGIPDGMKERVFEHGATGADSAGTGLGLYLVQTLVDQYGGDVAVADNEPTGTVFHVTLPLAE